MGTCELCGADSVSTYKTTTSGARVDACNRCIDRLGLSKPLPTLNQNRANTKPSSVRMSGPNIMHKSERELAPDFHKRIRQSRKNKGWDQREFARRMNERLNIVQKIENGNRPTDSLIKKIEKVLDVELMIESQAANSRQTINQGSRNMTIGDAYEELFQVGNSLQDIPLHVIHLDQDDPRKCTSRKLAKHGGCFLHKSLTKSPKRGLLLDPLSGILIGPDDSTSIERGSSIVSLDCSWKEIEPSLAMLQRSTRLEGRTLPVVLAANPISWGKPGRLSNVEAFAVCLTIFDRWEQARAIMKPFKFSEEFFSLNEQPLEAYSKAGTNAELAEIQWEFFDKPTED